VYFTKQIGKYQMEAEKNYWNIKVKEVKRVEIQATGTNKF